MFHTEDLSRKSRNSYFFWFALAPRESLDFYLFTDKKRLAYQMLPRHFIATAS